MPSLRSKQLLLKAAQLSQQQEQKISKKEIEKKIHQIKYLSSQKKISKASLKKEITLLEKHLRGIFLLEKKLKEKQKSSRKEIKSLKKQLQNFKKQLSAAKDPQLRKKVDKLSNLVGDLMAKKEVQKEVQFEKAKAKLPQKPPQKPSPKHPPQLPLKKPIPASTVITLKKIDQLQDRIFALKKSGKYPREKLAPLEQRLTALEKNLTLSSALPSAPPTAEPIKHKLLFGPPGTKEPPELKKISDDIDELPIPPPPKIKKK